VFAMGGAAVSWQSRKQSLIALSTLEAEYIACSDAVRETKWLLQLAKDVAEPSARATESSSTANPVTLFCDNQGALNTIVSGVSKASTKHIDVRFHNSRHAYASGILNCTYIPSNENTADICTKALPAVQHKVLMGKLGMRMSAESR
jgi:putative hemolysin